jgi:hypothetical protein
MSGNLQLVDPVARINVPAAIQSEALVSLDSGEQIINKNPNWHMRAWLTVNRQTGALTGFCRTWSLDGSGTREPRRWRRRASMTLGMSQDPARSRSATASARTRAGSWPASSAARKVRHSHRAW